MLLASKNPYFTVYERIIFDFVDDHEYKLEAMASMGV